MPPGFAEATLRNEHVHLYEPDHRGYLRVSVSAGELIGEFRWVETTDEPTSPIATGARWRIVEGRPGAVLA